MTLYKLTASGACNTETGESFPFADGNASYEQYKAWSAQGNTADPEDPTDLASDVWAAYRQRRELYLGRLSDIAGRYQRRGDAAVPPAADAIAEGLLAMPADPALKAITDPHALSTAIVAAANQLLRAQLTDTTTATTIKAALDQVFKT